MSQTDFEYDKNGNVTYKNVLNLEQNTEYESDYQYENDLLIKEEHYENEQLSGYVVYEYK